MKARILFAGEEVGEVTVEDGMATGTTDYARGLIKDLYVTDAQGAQVHPGDGDRFVRSLPRAITGSYTRAELMD